MKENKTLEQAAAESGMCERTARRWKEGELPSETRRERTWRTRSDPFEAVWQSDVLPLLMADRERAQENAGHRQLQAKTIFRSLCDQYEGQFEPGQLRTLQRRIRVWRAQEGPDKEVMFPQQHEPGRQAAIDFTHCDELGVTIEGTPFLHLLFVFRLAFSRWTRVSLAFGETFEALVSGVQDALWALGGVPHVLRHDNLSAATHELKRTGGRALTRRFEAVLEHYDMTSSRITPGEAHENGVAEKANDLVKSTLQQELLLRGSSDFDSPRSYMTWVRQTVERRMNAQCAAELEVERSILQPLPASRVPEFTTHRPTVRRWSTFRLGSRVYSVPSRLIGHEVEVRQYADEVEVRYGGRVVEQFERLRGQEQARIDYRHIIWSLVRKPGAFAQYRYREELFPTLNFRRAYDALRKWRDERGANIEYVRVLHLAASTMESKVDAALELLLASGERFDYFAIKELAAPSLPRSAPVVVVPQPNLLDYDKLLVGGAL